MPDPIIVHYNDIESMVGKTLHPSDWHSVSQEQINTFADVTGDHNWIHVDVERASVELGAPIAHGFLTLSLIPQFKAQIVEFVGVSRGYNYGANSIRFTNTVPVGSRVRGHQLIKEVIRRGKGKQVVSTFTIEIEGEKRPACVADIIVILYP